MVQGPKLIRRRTAGWKVFSAAALVGLFGTTTLCPAALAGSGEPMLEVTLTGSLEERFSQFKTNQRRSWGAEVLVPIASFLQLSAGHTFLEDKDTFNGEYREFQSERGVALPPGSIESIETYIDSTVNGVIFQTLGYVRPSIFGGALWRTYCEENSMADYGCIEQDLSWNAGAGLSMRVTNNLRLGITYRVTPSVTHKKDKRLDTLTSLSLTITF